MQNRADQDTSRPGQCATGRGAGWTGPGWLTLPAPTQTSTYVEPKREVGLPEALPGVDCLIPQQHTLRTMVGAHLKKFLIYLNLVS